MGKKTVIGQGFLLVLLLIGTCYSQGMGDSKYYDWMGTPIISSDQKTKLMPDWLNPFTAGRPDWDPYGPGSIFYPAANRAEWDPYAPAYGRGILNMEPADPMAEGLTLQGNLRTPNQLYLQRDGFLVTDGQVVLGEPYTLWAYAGYFGSFVLYDNDEKALSQSYISPGWYRISGLYPEILWSHRYRFTSAGQSSNVLPVLVESGGYPTDYGLTGRVVDISGKGIRGVRVLISSSDGGVLTATTNTQGYYGFDAPSGTYTIAAELPGYSFTPSTARVWTGTISVAQIIIGYALGTTPPATATPPAVANQPYDSQLITGYPEAVDDGAVAGWVQGRITDQNGLPIPLASVIADGLRTPAASDEQGNYRIALSPGMHRINADKAGFGIQPEAVLVYSGQTTTLDLIGKKVATLGSGR
jgi:hypothetical protein